MAGTGFAAVARKRTCVVDTCMVGWACPSGASCR